MWREWDQLISILYGEELVALGSETAVMYPAHQNNCGYVAGKAEQARLLVTCPERIGCGTPWTAPNDVCLETDEEKPSQNPTPSQPDYTLELRRDGSLVRLMRSPPLACHRQGEVLMSLTLKTIW